MNTKNLKIGRGVYIGNNAHLSIDSIEIGHYTLLASNVSIVGGDHLFNQVGIPIKETGRAERKGVKIGFDCWIGHGVTIFDGVEIGNGSIIGAGSLVTKSIPCNSIAIGSPAKIIKKRFTDENFEKHIKSLQKKLDQLI